jgi:hypothetical protein
MALFDDLAQDIVVEEFYRMALHDYTSGTSLEVLEANIRLYEDLELYLPCAGIHRAVEEIRKLEAIMSGVDTMIYNETLIDKITEIQDDERGDS